MVQNSNQFDIGREKGELSLAQNFNVVNGKVASTETATLGAAHAVKIADVAGTLPSFLQVDADTDVIFGFVPYNIKTTTYDANEPVKVAGEGTFMHMEANAAIARGAQLGYVVANQRVATAAALDTIIGVAYDKATAQGDLIRVKITTNGVKVAVPSA